MPDETSGDGDDTRSILELLSAALSDEGAPTTSELFDLVTNSRRFYVLEYVTEAPTDCVAFGDVVDRVSARERDDVTRDYRKRVATSLRHVHVPKLADAGVVEYDHRSRTIRYRGGDTVEQCVGLVADPA